MRPWDASALPCGAGDLRPSWVSDRLPHRCERYREPSGLVLSNRPPTCESMPELPEVEVTRLSFADRIAGAHIESVQVGKPLRWPLGCRPALLVGQQVLAVRRRGNY